MATTMQSRTLARPKTKMAEVVVACDGSCLGNPGGATGWAWVASNGQWSSSCQPTGTNQVAELWGVLSVLRDFPTEQLVIQVDSEYAMKVATVWGKAWARNGWTTRDGSPVKNIALVKAIYSLMLRREAPVRFEKVPGHDTGDRWPLNTAADKRAQEAAREAKRTGVTTTFTGTDRSVVGRDVRPAEPKVGGKRKPERCTSCDAIITIDNQCNCSRG